MFQGLSFDLGDSTVWEFMFPNNDKPLLKIPDAEDDLNDMDDDEVGYCHLDDGYWLSLLYENV